MEKLTKPVSEQRARLTIRLDDLSKEEVQDWHAFVSSKRIDDRRSNDRFACTRNCSDPDGPVAVGGVPLFKLGGFSDPLSSPGDL